MRVLTLFALALCTASAAFGQDGAPPSEPRSQSVIVMPNPTAMQLRAGEIRRAEGPVRKGDVLLSVPYAYRRTGKLAADLHVFGKDKLVLRAGAPGYYAGSFGFGGVNAGAETWCFLPRAAGQKEDDVCLMRGADKTTIVPVFSAALVTSLYFYGRSDFADPFAVTEQPVNLGDDLRLEYKFGTQVSNTLHLDYWVGGTFIQKMTVKKKDDNFSIRMLGEVVTIKPGATLENAIVERQAAPPPPPADPKVPAITLPVRDFGIAAMAVNNDFKPVSGVAKPGDMLFEQTAIIGPYVRQTINPNGRITRLGDAGDLLRPVKMGPNLIFCSDRRDRWFGSYSHCLQDLDGDWKADVAWVDDFSSSGGPITGKNVKLDAPVPLEKVPESEWGKAVIRLRYVGVTGERMGEDGKVLPGKISVALEYSEVGKPGVSVLKRGGLSIPPEGKVGLVNPNVEFSDLTPSGETRFAVSSGIPPGPFDPTRLFAPTQ
jgi:hypothetical protein